MTEPSASTEASSTLPGEPSEAEYDDRLIRVRAAMQARGLAGLVLTDPANLYYLSGYNAWSFYTPQLLLVPAQGPMVLFARDMDAQGAHRTTFLRGESVVGYPEVLVHRRYAHPFDWVGEQINRRGLLPGGEKLGVELDSHYFSPRAFIALDAALPNHRLVDCDELVNWVRVVKSDHEIAVMHTAARVTTVAMQAAIDTIGVGVPQHVVAAEIAKAQALGDGEAWGDFPAIVPMMPTGVAADTPHLTWTDRRFVRDEAVVIELAGVHRRYHVPLARTLVLGQPSDELRLLEEPVAEGLSKVLAQMTPGTDVTHLADTWNETLARHGLYKASRLGYSIGIGYPPDWGERTVSIRSEDTTVLETNMTFHIICGMWMTGYGYEVSESVRVTESGAEPFTDFPRGLLAR